MWTVILILAYLATLVFIWRGWGVLGRIGCYIALHLLAIPGWIFVIAANLGGGQPSVELTPHIYVLAVMVAFSAGSILMRPRTLQLRARRQEAIRQAAERLGYSAPYAAGGGTVISDPPPPAGPPHRPDTPPRGPNTIAPKSPGSGERD